MWLYRKKDYIKRYLNISLLDLMLRAFFGDTLHTYCFKRIRCWNIYSIIICYTYRDATPHSTPVPTPTKGTPVHTSLHPGKHQSADNSERIIPVEVAKSETEFSGNLILRLPNLNPFEILFRAFIRQFKYFFLSLRLVWRMQLKLI